MSEYTTENQLELPIIEDVQGETVKFIRLDMDDLQAWANEKRSTAKIREQARVNADKAISPYERTLAMQNFIRTQRIEAADLMADVYEPDGTVLVISKSLKKAGMGDEDVVRIRKRMHYLHQVKVAEKIMSPPPPVATDATTNEDGASPLPDASTATGS